MNQSVQYPAPAGATDQDLMNEIADRRQDAFENLRNRMAGVVFSTAYGVLNNCMDAEDVALDVFRQVWDKAATYEPRKGKPLTWVTTMARNRAIDRLRGNQRRHRLREDFRAQHEVLSPAMTHRDASDIAELQDQKRILKRAMAQLTVGQREAIELVYFRGLKQCEAAALINQPVGTVKARLRRGIAKLREILPGLEEVA